MTNNFGVASAVLHVKLMRITFQNMFPTCYEEVEARHCAMHTKPVGVDRRVRRIVESNCRTSRN